jgi:hypothetical protein
VDQEVLGIRETREDADRPPREAFLRTLQLVYGTPQPDDAMPDFPTPTPVPITYAFLDRLKAFVDFVSPEGGLYLTFDDFWTLMRYKLTRESAEDAAQWQEINLLLQKAARTRLGNSGYRLPIRNPRAFDANLRMALGGVDPDFDGVPQVDTIYDLYNQPITRESVVNAIQDILYFEDIADFQRMMSLKISIDRQWETINSILELAGQNKRGTPYTLPTGHDPMNFSANLQDSLGVLVFPTLHDAHPISDLNAYHNSLLTLERYFYLSAEALQYVLAVAYKPNAARDEWERVYELLAGAYEKKVSAERQQQLKDIREESGFDAMILFAVSGQSDPQSAFERLKEYIRDPKSIELLDSVAERVKLDQPVTEWEQVYAITEQGMTARLGRPIAQRVVWHNIHPAPDARILQITTGLDPTVNQDAVRWRTFGVESTWTVDNPPVPNFGWAISSPVLLLSEGQRTITLTLRFDSREFDETAIRNAFASSDPKNSPFVVQVSTEKGWIEPESVAASRIAVNTEALSASMTFTLTFSESAAPIVPLPEEYDYGQYPTLRLLMRQRWVINAQGTSGRYETLYPPFRHLILRHVALQVEVRGLTPAQIQNDESVLDAEQAFEPFGFRPTVGSRFYAGHPELILKRLDRLSFDIEWMDLPANNLVEYYVNYPAKPQIEQTGFTVRVSMVEDRRRMRLTDAVGLFNMAAANSPRSIDIAVASALREKYPAFNYTPRLSAETNPNDIRAWGRYIEWELNAPDFQHAVYPAQAAHLSRKLALDIAEKTTAGKDYTINPPYTPKIRQMRLNYTASVAVDMADYVSGDYATGVATGLATGLEVRPRSDRVYHIQPFGYNEVISSTGQYDFLPKFENVGELYIGLEGVDAPQNLSMLFQMAEGSANPDIVPAPIRWSYLSGNQWLSLDDGKVLSDTTRGLINSGIIEFRLEPTLPNTLLSPEYYWIRAAIPYNSTSVCDTIAIHTQAVSATFVDQDNAPDHLSQPLPPGRIADLVAPNPYIEGIRQPYTSQGGKTAEQDRTFYTRISERLRHKHRALTIWDYEHMVLERFPAIYKAKCLPARAENPGLVEVVVIPDITDKLPSNPFEPKAPTNLIADIEHYLRQYVPPYAEVKVKNAYYVPVKLRFAVRFKPGYNEGYNIHRLNSDITRFLSPWAFAEGQDIVIGGRIYANVLINFIEEQPYVDYVAQLKLFTSEDRKTYRLAPESPDGYWVETVRPDGVLVSAEQHEIDILSEVGYEEENLTGINYMKIELDFVVS